MFNCTQCLKTSLSGEHMNKFTVSFRDKTYLYVRITKRGKDAQAQVEDITVFPEEKIESFRKQGYKILGRFQTKGKEIEKEEQLCKECFKSHVV